MITTNKVLRLAGPGPANLNKSAVLDHSRMDVVAVIQSGGKFTRFDETPLVSSNGLGLIPHRFGLLDSTDHR
jgi:hypothetical protein